MTWMNSVFRLQRFAASNTSTTTATTTSPATAALTGVFRTMSSASFPVTESIREKLTAAFQPTHLDVINESYMHKVPKNSETHFKVVVVSSQFESTKTPLQRHRLINDVLAEELQGPVHALSIVAKTPAQWENNSVITPSPKCKGGDGSL